MKNSRYDRAFALLQAAGIPRNQVMPLSHRLLWRVGIHVPPPLLAPFRINVLVFGLHFGAGWALGMFFGVLNRLGEGFVVLITGAAVGLAFGLMMAALCRKARLARKLPTWRELVQQ